MQFKKSQQLYRVVLIYKNGMSRAIKVRAASREVAEQRALKRNTNALEVQRDA
jgi:hypothetical protein